jgi:hypothetical protein
VLYRGRGRIVGEIGRDGAIRFAHGVPRMPRLMTAQQAVKAGIISPAVASIVQMLSKVAAQRGTTTKQVLSEFTADTKNRKAAQ